MSDARERYDRAMASIRTGLTLHQGADGFEARASLAYTEMAKAGEVAPLRRKYRVGKLLKKVR